MEASDKLRKALHEEEDLNETKYIENLSRDPKTNYFLCKATKTVKPSVESERTLTPAHGLEAPKKRLLYLVITYQQFLSQILQKMNFLLQLSTKLCTMHCKGRV